MQELQHHGVTHLYIPKYGHHLHPRLETIVKRADGLAAAAIKLLVHAVYDGRTPHGNVCARMSDSAPGSIQVVQPLTRQRCASGLDWRERLNISSDAIVFGRYGSYGGFDDPATREAIVRVARLRPSSIIFLLVNSEPLSNGCDGESGGGGFSTEPASGDDATCHPNVGLHLPSFIDTPFTSRVAYHAWLASAQEQQTALWGNYAFATVRNR